MVDARASRPPCDLDCRARRASFWRPNGKGLSHGMDPGVRSTAQLDPIHARCGVTDPRAVRPACTAAGEAPLVCDRRGRDRGARGRLGLRDARLARRHELPVRRRVRRPENRVDRARGRVSVRHLRVHGPVRDHEGIGGGHHGRPPVAAAACRVLLRCLHRRRGGVRGAGRDRGRLHDRPRVQAVPRRRTQFDRQHVARGVGAIGTPVHTLAAVSGLPESDLSAMIGRILPITGMIVPFWLVRAMVGWAETFEVLPAILVVGASFSVTQYLWSNHVDSNLVDIAGGVVSLLATLVFLRFWRPKRVWRFEEERAAAPAGATPARKYTAGQILKAWMPFAILSLTVFAWGLPAIKGAINRTTTPVWTVPLLHNAVSRAAPVVAKLTPEAARFDFNWLSATGTGCFIAAIIAGLVLGVGPVQLAKIFWHTLKRMKLAVIAISFMLGLGYTTRYSGLDAVLGLAFTRSGWFYPFFGTYLGWLGVALTGSDTSSNALFGSLQRISSKQLGIDPVLMCAANSAARVMGKMWDAQSITIATAATEQVVTAGLSIR